MARRGGGPEGDMGIMFLILIVVIVGAVLFFVFGLKKKDHFKTGPQLAGGNTNYGY